MLLVKAEFVSGPRTYTCNNEYDAEVLSVLLSNFQIDHSIVGSEVVDSEQFQLDTLEESCS